MVTVRSSLETAHCKRVESDQQGRTDGTTTSANTYTKKIIINPNSKCTDRGDSFTAG